MDKSSSVISKAKTQANCSCYVWGARGQDLLQKSDPASWIYSMETADSGYTRQGNTDRAMSRFSYLKGRGYREILAFDCSGFVYWVYSSCGLMNERTNAQRYYNKCSAHKNKSELRAGDLVFHHNGSKISHIGIYAGDGYVLHCKGRDYGVVYEKLTAYNWNCFGKWKGVYDDDAPMPDAKKYVRANGTVRIRSLPSTEGKCLNITANGQEFEYVETASTGWYKIKYKDGYAYISNKYTTIVTK